MPKLGWWERNGVEWNGGSMRPIWDGVGRQASLIVIQVVKSRAGR